MAAAQAVLILLLLWSTVDAAAPPGFDCNFDNDFCGWKLYAKGFPLELGNQTTTAGTGPSGDHTSGSGSYVYLDASNGTAGDIGKIFSPKIDTSTDTRCLTFWYHMHGPHAGSLEVEFTPIKGSVWGRTGDQGDDWVWANLTLNSVTDKDRVRFKLTRGSDGIVAIDDVALADGKCEEVVMTLDASEYLLYPPFAYVTVTFNVSAGSPEPQNLMCVMDLRDGKGEVEFDLKLNHPYRLMFTDTGNYTINAVVSSARASQLPSPPWIPPMTWEELHWSLRRVGAGEIKIVQNISRHVVVLEKMSGPLLESSFPAVAQNQTLDVRFYLYTGPSGHLCNLIWDFGNGTSVTRQRKGQGKNAFDTESVTYSAFGWYIINVTAETPLETVTAVYNISVIRTFQDRDIQISARPQYGGLNMVTNISVEWTGYGIGSTPDDVYVLIEFGEVPVPLPLGITSNTSLDLQLWPPPKLPFGRSPSNPFVQQLQFKQAGQFEIKVKVYNAAQTLERNYTIDVYAKFQNPRIIKCFRPEVPRYIECKEGLEDNGLFFFIGTNISFRVVDDNNAAADRCVFLAVPSEGGTRTEVNLTKTTNPFVVDSLETLRKAGQWNITVTAVNPMHQATINTRVIMVEKMLNFEITHNEKKMAPGIAKTFEISFGEQGLKTCLTIDFGDSSPVEVYADDSSSHCDPQAAFTGKLTGLRKVKHTYRQEGYYKVTAIARSSHNNITRHLHLNINSHGCYPPKVNIENAAHVFYEPRIRKKGDIIKFRAIPSIESDIWNNIKTWDIHEIDEDWGNVTSQVDLTGRKVDEAELRLEPWTLDLKLYRVTFTMTLTGYDNKFRLTGSDYSYFKVVESALVGVMINGGTAEIVHGVGQSLYLTPLSFSFDASVLNNNPAASGLSVVSWTCTFRPTEPPGNPNQDSTQTCPEHLTTPPVAINGSSGRFNEAQSSLTQGYTYNLTAVLQKDSRNTTASLDIVVLHGVPLKLTLECAGGSMCLNFLKEKLVVKSARLGLRANCMENCGPDLETLRYRWNISLHDYRWVETGGWRPLQPAEMVTDGRTLGYETLSPELAIYPSLFEAFASTTHYRVECATTATDASGQVHDGWAVTYFQLNTPPRGGSCTIEPEEMVATVEKLFRIQCQGWQDDGEIEQYQFYTYHDNTTVPLQLTWVMTSQGDVDINVTIGRGPKRLNYYSNVQVVVRDTMGASTMQEIGAVRVTPSWIRSEKWKKDLKKKSAEGDLISVTEFATVVANNVNQNKLDKDSNYVGPEDTTANSSFTDQNGTTAETFEQTSEFPPAAELEYEHERDERAVLREQAVEAFTTMPLNDVMSMNQILSTTMELLNFPDEVTNSAQMTVMSIVRKMTENLNDEEQVTSDERIKNLKYMIAAPGSCLAAGGLSGFDGTLTMLERAEHTSLFDDYDVDSLAHDDECLELKKQKPRTIEEATQRQLRLANCMLTRANSTQLFESGREIMRRVVSSFINNSIIGESQQFSTKHQNTRLSWTSATDILGKPIALDGSNVSVEFPADLGDIFPDGVEENDTLMLELTENANMPLRYTPGAKNLASATKFVTVNIQQDSSRNQTNVTTLANPLKVKIPRGEEQTRLEYMRVDASTNPWRMFVQHHTEILRPGSSLHITLCVEMADVGLAVVISLGDPLNHLTGQCNASFLVLPQRQDLNEPTCSNLMLDNQQVADYLGPAYIGVRQLLPNEMDLDVSDCKQLPDYWGNDTQDTMFTTNYSIKIFTSGCYVWSEELKDWTSEGLRVHSDTDESLTVCEAWQLGTLAAGWMVAPNRIDWDFVFSNFDFDKNPTLYVTEIIVLVIFVMAIIWARRKDRKDIEKLGLAPLQDNNPRHKYYYKITVTTGMRSEAGTKSKVFFKLVGVKEDTGVRQFTDTKRDIFQRTSTDGFLMATPRALGHLHCVHIWHDNSGDGDWASWYLDHMTVEDIQTGERWMFLANTWLAVEKGNGKVDRIIHSSTPEQLAEFSQSVKLQSRQKLKDEHLWYSIVTRPPQSRFTRVQRVCCCLCLLLTSMLANAMFYKTEDDERTVSEAFVLHLGPFTLSPQQVFIGVMSTLVVFPINFILVTFFRKSRLRHQRPSQVDIALQVLKQAESQGSAGQLQSETDCEANKEAVADVSQSTSLSLDPAKDEKKKKWSLPWWCRIVAWILWALTCLVSAAFVTFYGIQFEDATCREWISSMLISLFTSVFVTQPIKIFLLVILQVLILKKTDDEVDDLEEEPTRFASDELPLHADNQQSCDAAAAESRDTPQYKPLKGSALKAARRQRLKEVQTWRMLHDIITHGLFLAILLYLAHRDRALNMFLYKDTLHRVFIKNDQADFDKVSNTQEFWEWTRSGLVNGIRAGPYYNQFPPFMLRGFVNDKVSKILGYATMRQLRVKPGGCRVLEMMKQTVKECNTAYSIYEQEEGDFDIGWQQKTVNNTVNSTAEWYNYASGDELDSYPYWGQLAVYGGGGYVVRLRGSRLDLLDLMTRLESEMWIDRYTRAVFIEFTTYNAQVNLFSIARILAEFHPSGGIVPSYHFEPAMLLPYAASAFYIHLALQILFCCFILFLTLRLMAALFKQRLAFFKGFWNIIELCIIAMSWSAIVIYFFCLFETQKQTAKVKETEGLGYVSFQYVAYWHEVLGYLLSWAVFFATVKFLKLLRFNRRISLLAATLKECSGALLNFSLVFWVVFLSFDMLFFLIYMTIDDRYSSFMGSAVANMLMIMGKFSTHDMMMADPALTAALMFLYCVSMTYLLLNIFLAILNEGFQKQRDTLTKQKNDHEILSFIFCRIRRFLGVQTQVGSLAVEDESQADEREHTSEADADSGSHRTLEERVDQLLAHLSETQTTHFFEETLELALHEAQPSVESPPNPEAAM